MTMHKRISYTVWPLAAIILLAALVGSYRSTPTASSAVPFLLVDPGHGGADGGAIGGDGTLEKDINLAIAVPLADTLAVFGYPVTMTRDRDASIHDEGVTTLRKQKISDMHNRLKLYEQATLTVGIHQNFYPVSKYSGTQMFYAAAHPESRVLAEQIRQTVVSALQPDNTRALKTGTDVFLLERTTRPAVFVECGFLSNPDELSRLKTKEYQRKMALAVAVGVMQYDP